MRDSSDRRSVTPTAHTSYSKKRLGGYLVEAGLLTPAQIDVALNDQKLTGMRFGEILAARGWVKQQTIEYLMHKVVLPEQKDVKQPASRTMTASQQSGNVSARAADIPSPHGSEAGKQAIRRDALIAKPLSSSNQPDGDVSWVG
ncbi:MULTISPECIES: hypothetical protein [Cyanophyceae]|uniref:Uncharacterized protein n=1 Tax=Stenomitos frigidus AS-A4 TaxID=2933935 RepID=A0ABV0KGZ1_9CYAN|nr:hypothetical protein [Phormidium sp. FACHB-592]